MSEDADARAAKQEAAAKGRVEAIRREQESEREAHRRTVEQEAEKSRAGLDECMKELTKPEQRQVRLQAYLHVLRGDWDQPTHLQTAVDAIALRLARYMVEGKV